MSVEIIYVLLLMRSLAAVLVILGNVNLKEQGRIQDFA